MKNLIRRSVSISTNISHYLWQAVSILIIRFNEIEALERWKIKLGISTKRLVRLLYRKTIKMNITYLSSLYLQFALDQSERL